MKKITILFVLLLCLFFSEAHADVSVLFLNVGKGDAALITCGDTNIMVDVGPKDASSIVEYVLEQSNAEHLTGILITHTDKDHVGALKKLLKAGITADCLYYSPFWIQGEEKEHPVISAADQYQTPAVAAEAGTSLSLAEDVTLTVLGPLTADTENENNNSLVMILETPWGSVLFSGDMEKEEENDLLDAGVISHANVLKVSHHGRDDASSKAFLRKVAPSLAVISTDTAVDAKTASAKILARLRNLGAQVILTQDTQYGWLVTLSEQGITCVEWEKP